MLSVIIPMYNEADNVEPLCERVFPVLQRIGRPFEVIFVNDGSRDETGARLDAAVARHPQALVLHFKRNVGQTAAMMAGIDRASGDILVPMDGDLQNDPEDIPRLVEKLDEGYDVVSGWRAERHDDALKRKLPSSIANRLISWISGVKLNDYGCTLKAYRRDVLTGYRLYGEMHRFVPIYAHWQGARITEMVVKHHPRRHGSSKYGLNRVFKVLLDLLVVKFLTQYETKPIYIFGGLGFGLFLISGLALTYALYLKVFEATSLIQTPLPVLSAFTFTSGVVCILMGLIAELLVRVYFESRGQTPYVVSRVEGQPTHAGDEPVTPIQRRTGSDPA